MEANTLENTRLGYGILDTSVGEWLACNDIARYTYLGHPEQDAKLCVRELLRILGKRFVSEEANLIWREIENYRAIQLDLFAPPTGAVGQISFEQAARSWYAAYGLQFEKQWYLLLEAPLNFQYARTGHERVKGRWLRFLHPDLLFFVEAGFTPGEILAVLSSLPFGGWRGISRLPGKPYDLALASLWARLAAELIGFVLDDITLKQAMLEIAAHTSRLSQQQSYPVNPAIATLDYFQRLELAGLAPHLA